MNGSNCESFWKEAAEEHARVTQRNAAMIFSVDLSGNVVEWNEKAEAMTNFTSAEAVGASFVRTFVPPEHRPEISELMQEAIMSVTANSYRLPLSTKTDSPPTVLLSLTARQSARGQVVGVQAIALDVTEMCNVLEEKKIVADDMTTLFNSANVSIIGIDNVGIVTDWNSEASNLLGYSRSETVGKLFVANFITQQYYQTMMDTLWKAVAGTDTNNLEISICTKGGETKDLLLNVSTRRGPTGEFNGAIVVCQDLAHMHEHFFQNAPVTDDLFAFINTANLPIFAVDCSGVLTEWNPKVASLSGYSRDESIGQHFVSGFFPPEMRPSVEKVLTAAIAGEDTESFELQLISKFGERCTVLLSATPQRDPAGHVKGVIGISQDINALKKAMAQSQRVADDLTRIIETANAPIFGVDTLGRVTEWNQKLADLSQVTKAEILGRPLVANFINDDYCKSVSYVLVKALHGEETTSFELPLVKNGEVKAVLLLNAATCRGSDGEVVGVICAGQDVTQIKTMTAQQQGIADDLSRLIDSANAPIFGVDTDGLVTEWNRKAALILGYSKDEAMGNSLVDKFILPADQSSVSKVLENALAGKETANFELPLMSKHGDRYTILLNATTRRDAKGKVIGVVGVGQDISELNQVMAESKRVAEDWMRLIETANAPILGIDVDGKVTEWNAKASSLLGFSKEAALGKHLVKTFIPDEFKEPVQQVLSDALVGKETANFEFSIFTMNGARKEILLNATGRRGPSADIIGVIGVGQDITQIREITKEQERVADDLSRLIETANAPIFGVDLNGMVNEWNLKAAEMLGYRKDEAIGKKFILSFIQPENRSSVADVVTKAVAGEETSNYELMLVSKTKKRYTVLLNATTRRDAKGAITGVVGVGQDITKLNAVMMESKRIAEDLTRLIETANAPIFGIDTMARVNEWNAKASSLLGIMKEEAMGKPLVESFIKEEYKDSVNEVLAAALIGKETANFEFAMFTKAGERKDILLNATTRRGPDGEVIGMIGVGQDITQIKIVQTEQEMIADDLSRLIESANAPIFGVDTNFMVTEWNRKSADILGFTKEEAMGKHLVQTFIQPEDSESVLEVLRNALAGIETANFELPFLSRHKNLFTILLNATTRRDPKGEIIGVVGVGQDITELNQVMAEAKRVADDLMRLIETANAPIFGIDTMGNVNEWNACAASLLGITREEAMGKSLVNEFISEEFKHSVNEVLAVALIGKETANFGFPIFTKTGERKDILLNATTRRGPDGQVIGMIGVGQDITRIKEATMEAERIADDLSRLIESANAPIFGVDLNGMVTEWNAMAASMLGYTKKQTLGKHLVANFIQPENEKSVIDVLNKALEGEETANYELPLISSTGERFTVLLNACTCRDNKGNITGVVGVGQDITELRHMMAQSRHVADDLTRLIESANAPIFGIDTFGNVSEWNRKTAEITSFSKAEAMNKHLVSSFIHEDHRASVSEVLSKALEGHETSNYELPLFTKLGLRRDILFNATARRSANGDIIGVVGVGQDITKIKQVLEREKRAVDDWTRLIETANAPIFGIDMEGRVTEWNAKATEVSGYTKAETMNKHLVNTFIHLEYRASVSDVFQTALGGQDVANFELTLFTKEGTRREVLLNATPRRGDDGKVEGVLGVGQDITELNRQRKEALRIAEDLGGIIETANAPILGVDTSGHVMEWNNKLVELSQFTKDEAIGMSFVHNFVSPQFQESVGYVLLRALNGEQTAAFEVPLLVKSGGSRAQLLLNATTRRGPNREVTGVICVGQDITDQLEASEEQQRIADDLRRLIDSANAPIFGVDTQGMVTEWNRKAADMLGYTKEETIGQNLVKNFIQPEDRFDVEQVLARALTGLETANYTLPLMAKYGKRYSVLLNATTRRDGKGWITGVVGVGQDITELNEIMAESKRIADDLTRLIETANAPIFGIDTDYKVTEWNAMASRLLGYSKSEALGKNLVTTFITEEFKQSVHEVLSQALVGKERANFEFPIFTVDGERKDILLNATTRRGPDGQIIGVIGVGQDITRMNEITKEQELVADDLSRLIETANAPIFGVDLKGMVTEWNRKAADMLGYTKEETIGQDLVENFIQPENRRSVAAVLERAMTGEETTNYELHLLSRSQKHLTVLLNATTRRDAKGQVIGVVGVGQDITELNKLMAESKRVADDLTRLIEQANAPIFGINLEGLVTEWNRKVADTTEYTKEEALGQDLVEAFISSEYQESVRNVLQMALRGTQTANFDFPLFTKHKDRKIQILMNATPRRGPDGQVIGMIGVGQDITDMRAAKEAADLTANELKRLIDSANAPIFGIDQCYKVTEWNQMMGKISGIPGEEVLGTRLMDWLFDPAMRSSIEKVLSDTLQGQDTANFELRLTRRDPLGKEAGQVVLLLSATARVDATGGIIGVVSIGQDITEHKALEERKMRFMAVVSHELRSPIHGICGLSDALAACEKDPKREKMLKMVTNCSKRLLDLVTNIMDISSMRSKTLKLNKGNCSLTQIVEETVHIMEHAVDKHGRPVKRSTVELINKVDQANLPVIEADVYRITQVFYNLVMNALKFTSEGTVTLLGKIGPGANQVQVDITDTGVGVSAANTERIFAAFEQEDDSEARTCEGIGLGLPISREVIRRHGGEITVQSVLGEGSTFTVLLPIKGVDPTEDSSNQEENAPKQKKMVMVENDASVLTASDTKLGAANTQVSQVTTPSTADGGSHQVELPAAMPQAIQLAVKRGDKNISVEHARITVAVLTIVGFQDLVEALSCYELVVVLNQVNAAYEAILAGHNKIFRTDSVSGERCVVLTGIDEDVGNSKILSFAFGMLQAVRRVKLPASANKMELRICIHTAPGEVCVIGSKPYKYCLFGRVVHEVNLLDLTSMPGCVNISQGAHKGLASSMTKDKLPKGSRLFDFQEVDFGKMKLASCLLAASWVQDSSVHEHTASFVGKVVKPVALDPINVGAPTAVAVADQPPEIESSRCPVASQALAVQRTPPVQQTPPVQHTPPEAVRCDIKSPENMAKIPDEVVLRRTNNIDGPFHILSVDDDPVNQEVIQGMFEPEGFEIFVAMNGFECLAHMKKIVAEGHEFPRMILLDNMMPGMGGIEVCKILRQQFNPLELPIIMLTCRTAVEDIAEALSGGCNEYVMKPFNRLELLARVRGLMSTSTIYKELAVTCKYFRANGAAAPQALAAVPAIEPAYKIETVPAAPAPVVVPKPPPAPAPAEPLPIVRNEVVVSKPQPPLVSAGSLAKRQFSLRPFMQGRICRSSADDEAMEVPVSQLRNEVRSLRQRLREQERANWIARAEHAAMRASLSQFQDEANHVWERLTEAERLLNVVGEDRLQGLR